MTSQRVLWLCMLIGCGEVVAPGSDAPVVAVDVPTARVCSPTAPFGSPRPLGGFTANQDVVRFSRDERTVVFQDRTSGYDLEIATRASIEEPFGRATALTSVNSTADDFDATISHDGLRLVFSSTRGGTVGHLYVAARPSITDAFGAASELTDVQAPSGTSDDAHGYLRDDGAELWFTSVRAGGVGGRDLYRATAVGSGFSRAEQVLPLESASDDWLPVVSADGLTLYFGSTRAGGAGSFDIWTARRTSTSAGFGAPAPVTELGTDGAELPTWLSVDACRLYLSRNGVPMVAERIPPNTVQ